MEYLTLVLSILATLIAIFYYYLIRNRDYFKKHGVVHVPPQLIVGNIGGVFSKKSSMVEILQQIYDFHPDAKYVGFYEFTRPAIVVRDIELIKSFCVKNFESFQDHRPLSDEELDPLLGKSLFSIQGEKWKAQRAMLSPTFTPGKIKNMFTLMSRHAVHFSEYLSKLPEERRVVELKDVASKFTNDVIASCVFGMDVDSLNDPENLMYVNSRKALNFASFQSAVTILMYKSMPRLSKWLGLRLMSKELTKFFEDVVTSNVKTRDDKGIQRSDMLQSLMETRNKKQYGTGLNMQEIAIHAFTFLFGGFDTVSNQLCFVIHYLAVNPDVQKRLQEEIDEVLERKQGQMTYDDINGMEYIDAIINETMRLKPIAYFLDRVCVKDFELPPALPGEKPFTLQAGSTVWIPVYAIQRDPKYFDNPDTFDPDRFVNDGKRIMTSGAFIPFGLGPRMCIGNRFALTEIKILIFHLFARCDLKPCPETDEKLEIAKGSIAIAPENGFWVKVEPRSNPHQAIHTGVVNGTEYAKDE
ncbi:cytochrome P450 9e2-like [Hylaeus anthracinus]|uniref:cytochrome P450 9e2-like n=1 Tax=Hylaeus anthracinus TaxID=313031 RepID=UPI0023B891B1|nr:cytochrome P450 9e2-like [Hylaeus anthracinus]